jgi:putative transcriptional regulator
MMAARLTLDDLLLAHAAGKLAEPVALLVATHLTMSPASRCRYRRYEALGGFFLEGLPPEHVDDEALARTLARLEVDRPPAAPPPPRRAARLPAPLCDYVPDDIDGMNWRNYGSAAEADLLLDAPGYRTRLIKVRAGKAVPQHSHQGSELTLVLEGAFRDETGRYGRGDVAIADDTVDHKPMAEPGMDCLCLAVTDAPLRLTGPFGRLLNPFLRM